MIKMQEKTVPIRTDNFGYNSRYTNMTVYNPTMTRDSHGGGPTMSFITRSHFKQLSEKGVTMSQMADVSSYSKLSCISQNTHIQMLVLNQRLLKFFLGYDVFDITYGLPKNDPIVIYAETNFNNTQIIKGVVGGSTDELGTYYEIFPVDGQRLLVVVENYFLNFLTQSKDNCKQFVLDYLRCLDKFGLVSNQLNEFYLKLLFVDLYHNVLCLRA